MKNYDVALRPIHYASVSGGKDSFYVDNVVRTKYVPKLIEEMKEKGIEL